MESASAHDQSSGRGVRFRLSLPVLLAILTLAVAVLLALGTWQVLRQREANPARASREADIAAPPLDWRTDPPLTIEEADFHRVQVAGRWDNAHTMVLANVVRYGTRGEEAVTPLIPDDGGPAILVDRGWYPLSERDRVLVQLRDEDRAAVEGLARTAPKPEGASLLVTGSTSGRTPDGGWAWFDIASMSRELPYEVLPWRLIQGTRDPGGMDPPADMPIQFWGTDVSVEPHTQYAITWYSLAAALITIAVLRWRAERRGPAS
jgi:surfeit locus 1 family protein